MIRLGLIGADGGTAGGHALSILRSLAKGIYDARVTAICSHNQEEREALAQAFEIPFVTDRPEQMLDKVDAVMVMYRRGSEHLEAAMPFLERGYPVFIDKPFASTVEDAVKMAEAANRSGALLFAGSSLKYHPHTLKLKAQVRDALQRGEKLLSGYIAYTMHAIPEFGGLHFYSHHTIEQMQAVFGSDVKSVYAKAYGRRIAAVAHYEDFPVFLNNSTTNEGLFIGAHFEKDAIMHRQSSQDLNEKQFERFLEGILKKHAPEDPQLQIDAVKISVAMERSIAENREVFLSEL